MFLPRRQCKAGRRRRQAGLVGLQRKQPSSLCAFCPASHLFWISKVCSFSFHVLRCRSAPGLLRDQMLESFTTNERFQTDRDVEFHSAVAGPQSADGETRLLIAHAGKEPSSKYILIAILKGQSRHPLVPGNVPSEILHGPFKRSTLSLTCNLISLMYRAAL